MPKHSTFPLYDRIVGGGLRNLLNEWRDAGDSYHEIAYKLRSEYGIKVDQSTVYRWLLLEDEEAAS